MLRNRFVLFGLSKVIRYYSYCWRNYWFTVYASVLLVNGDAACTHALMHSCTQRADRNSLLPLEVLCSRELKNVKHFFVTFFRFFEYGTCVYVCIYNVIGGFNSKTLSDTAHRWELQTFLHPTPSTWLIRVWDRTAVAELLRVGVYWEEVFIR